MMKLILLTALAAVAVADPGYFYPGYYHQQNWPGFRAPGFSSTCYGCRGKRSAEPEPAYYAHPGFYYGLRPYAYGPGIAAHPTGTSYTQRSPQGLGKRSADEEPAAVEEAPRAYGIHPKGGKSFVANQVWGARAKRSAEPGYGYYGLLPYAGHAYHPGYATSYVGRTIWGLH